MTDPTTRRGFIGKTAAYGLGASALGARLARGDDPPKSAAKVPVVGLIGAGGMGRHDMGVFMDQKIPI
ncbi:MAG: hypothetical protein ABI353_07805, partial [Isosphaeraceae bacterium]